ncbi:MULTISPECIES: ABC transporter substrate-binding protein [Bradyrhizobium]|uniref:ABC transporter substrate-binding protein n=1 Tax=Bradyrhizobium TaxID=374 RepID=UPI00155E0784|nr:MULTISPECIES: ABC transporter substrate-binding protein [Bradyrhizobium]MDD1517516.1 branched-chain amino acid ABC transporter substrate-binding protein [Bradyrhizobium sp. WBAH30]MDD1541825.1 branched-chain amino acid ABC transporter substrate-binding protein [Bradyrhizobium sp. WBAH41]MDD1555309.1 branched-chain amino acid ABC transporter substrate-binding protein [Bradyrhizobium sp. WBAH23]MDD1564140.1 branched-chain amino acid ABC transporter substrate-binding protein [Bradyrhizobium sp.
MRVIGRMLFVSAIAVASLGAMSQQQHSVQPASDQEIRIGNVMPYSGPLSEFGAIGQAEAAYFDMVNARGGINGRKIRFITRDDNSDPATALELTRKLVETDGVHLMFGSFGTPGNLATRRYLNEKKIPQLFVATGDEELSQPNAFPWTMGWQPSFRSEGRIYANYIQAYYPRKKIVVLWQNDQFGRMLYKGIQEGLGDLNRHVLVDIAFDLADEHLDGHVSILKRAGADIFVFLGVPSTASKVIKLAASMNWRPVFIVNDASASIANAMAPAGLENSAGVISAAFLKDPSDPAWKNDPAMKDWFAFMDKYHQVESTNNSAAVYGYAAAEALAQVLKQCGDDFSRENIMRQAASLRDVNPSLALPNIRMSTSPNNYLPIRQMRLVQFDGRSWQQFGDVIETAFTEGAAR